MAAAASSPSLGVVIVDGICVVVDDAESRVVTDGGGEVKMQRVDEVRDESLATWSCDARKWRYLPRVSELE